MSKQSKTIARVLRHQPELVGLTLGKGGWVRVEDLLKGLKVIGIRMTVAELEALVMDNDKKRFTLSGDGRIRAAQGHSLAVDLDLVATTPPAELFHGTASASLDDIFRDGLLPGRRTHVHLSSLYDTAISVGRRHGSPVVLKVDAGAMVVSGHRFWMADNGVWLTDAVPPKFIGFASTGLQSS